MYWESYLTKNLQMTLNYHNQMIRRSTWSPGTWLPPGMLISMCSRYGTQFSWHDPTLTHALLHSIHSAIGGTE
jgi:hypothetical protein